MKYVLCKLFPKLCTFLLQMRRRSKSEMGKLSQIFVHDDIYHNENRLNGLFPANVMGFTACCTHHDDDWRSITCRFLPRWLVQQCLNGM